MNMRLILYILGVRITQAINFASTDFFSINLHTTEVNDGYEWGRLNLQSVTAESSLQEFLSTAELAQREFIAEKLNVKYVKSAPAAVELVTSQPNFDKPLTVPRRPLWNPSITAEEQIGRERDAFLDWRRHLNELQEKLGAAVTPYERNLELWKQLWRTLEKSDIVMILLDARNPLLFRCMDLEKYAAEQKCKCILLLNKADLTTEYVRKCWAEYFGKEGVSVIFFSAAKASKERKISEEDETNKKRQSISEDNSDTETESDDDSAIDVDEVNPLKEAEDDIELFKKQLGIIDEAVTNTASKLDRIQETLDKVIENLKLGKPIEFQEENKPTVNENETNINTDNEIQMQNSHEIFGREKLLEVLRKLKTRNLKNPPRLTVGMIGYPNVGKSSSVNVLMQTKKVSVSSMPGHTRHIQSLMLEDDIELLDCPGLVLPAYAVAPDLLLTAVLPIDQTPSTSVGTYINRGFMSAAGQPDVSRSARLFLKEAASGRLHWEQLPPGYQPAPLNCRIQEKRNETRKPTPRETRMVEGWRNTSAEIDSAFFAMKKSTSHVKGKPILGITGAQSTDRPVVGKPWKHEKKHANKNKREKLRRVYAHLDEH
ncbi:Large subunit GTPase 1-like [Papilio machaon]|uniref:Large subunit GTPase 1 homolog n=1 Tax=Papilio machaon TaxID=76193 RepID=A0A194R915_PAPMA|nr:Large subunit GTPase 1-like [Papilio machaon]